MFSYLFIFKKTLVNTLMAEETFTYFLTRLNFEEGWSALGSPLFIFNSLTLFTHSHSHSHFKPFSHLSLIYILPLSNKFNLLFGSKVLTVRRGPTSAQSPPLPQPESCLTSFAHFINMMQCALAMCHMTWAFFLSLFSEPW